MLVRRRLDPDQQWFAEARFGMFIHFGLYALLGRGEWVMYNENIARAQYERLAKRFNPRRFDADEWVRTARRAGARYITVTAKHHDGFCLFDSALTDYKITNTPFRRDLIGELIAACHRGKMRIVLYYSQPDWHHPNYVHRKGAFKDLQYDRPDDRPDWPDWPKFLDYMEGQVRELCTNYGRIDGIWFDGVQRTERAWRGRRLYRMIRELQPGAVVNDRAGCGDFFTPERSLSAPAAAAGYMVESCQSVARDAWGYQRRAALFPSDVLLRSLISMASAGGNYLLNVGPKPDGSLPPRWVTRLEALGRWLRIHGEAIHGTAGCPLHRESDALVYTRSTRSGNRLYLHLLRWPEADTVILRRLRQAPASAILLDSGRRLGIEGSKEGVVLRGFAAASRHPVAGVVVLEFEERDIFTPVPRPEPPQVQPVNRARSTFLRAGCARRTGFGPKGSILSLNRLPDGAAWIREQKAVWILHVPHQMEVAVTAHVACPAIHAGSPFTVRIAGQALKGCVPPTKGLDDFKPVRLGVVRVPAGRTTVSVCPDDVDYIFGCLRGITLRPTTKPRQR